MQQTPEGYIPYPDSRKVELSFSFGVISPEAAELAIPSSSPQSAVSQISQTIDEREEMSGKYATLETNIWILDGSMNIYPGEQIGWQTEAISDGDGAFLENQWIEFSFPEEQNSYGFTLIFDNTMPDDLPLQVNTTTYNAEGEQIGSVATIPIDFVHIINLQTVDYTKVRFEFPGTVIPNRRVRICGVRFGIEYVYDSRNTSLVTVRQSVSPWAESLPSSEIDATIDNSYKLYNMINPEGIYAYLQDGQYMEWTISIDGISVYMGRSYFTSAESEDGGLTATVTFNDRILAMDDTEYNGGQSGTWTLSEAISSILENSGTGMTAVYEEGLANVIIGKCVPQKTSSREAIRLCAQAAMCTCYVDRNNQIHFIRPVITQAAEIWTRNIQRNDAQIKVGKAYNTVKLTVRDEYLEAPEDVIYTASNAEADDFERAYEVQNPLVNDGEAVAQWILSWVERRTSYNVSVRGNPALDLLDTVQIDDIYNTNGFAILTKLNLTYDGGLSCEAEAIK